MLRRDRIIDDLSATTFGSTQTTTYLPDRSSIDNSLVAPASVVALQICRSNNRASCAALPVVGNSRKVRSTRASVTPSPSSYSQNAANFDERFSTSMVLGCPGGSEVPPVQEQSSVSVARIASLLAPHPVAHNRAPTTRAPHEVCTSAEHTPQSGSQRLRLAPTSRACAATAAAHPDRTAQQAHDGAVQAGRPTQIPATSIPGRRREARRRRPSTRATCLRRSRPDEGSGGTPNSEARPRPNSRRSATAEAPASSTAAPRLTSSRVRTSPLTLERGAAPTPVACASARGLPHELSVRPRVYRHAARCR